MLLFLNDVMKGQNASCSLGCLCRYIRVQEELGHGCKSDKNCNSDALGSHKTIKIAKCELKKKEKRKKKHLVLAALHDFNPFLLKVIRLFKKIVLSFQV